MKLKYYMRGLGIGIIVTAVIMGIALGGKRELTDAEIKERAETLGMVEESAVLLPSSPVEEPKEEIPAEEVAANDAVRRQAATAVAVKIAKQLQADAMIREAEDAVGVAGGTTADTTKAEDADAVGETAEVQERPVVNKQPVTIQVESGNGSDTVSRKLADAGLVENAETFDRYLCNHDYDYKITVGKHTIPAGSTYDEIARILISAAE